MHSGVCKLIFGVLRLAWIAFELESNDHVHIAQYCRTCARMSAMTQRMVPLDDVHLAVREWARPNEQPSIVLVHGLSSNSLLWESAAAELVRLGYHVVAIDLRGHGLSSKPDIGYDMRTVAGDVAALIEALDLNRPVVAGQSWGGNVVLELAHRHPNTTRGVCGVDGGLINLAQRFATWEQCAEAMQPPRLAGIQSSDFESKVLKQYSGWPEAAIRGTLACMERHADGTMSPWLTFDRHMLVLRGLWEHSPQHILPVIPCPVLFTLAGSKGKHSQKRDDYEQASLQNDRVRLEWFSSAHHDLHAQFPEKWASVLHQHIADGFFS
jgi:pimeloyl-ACP methyl ester carboxylesterase